MVNIKRQLAQLWRQSRPLTVVALLMLAALVFSIGGIFLDPRIITGAPAWLKPSKFALSSAIYAASIAWLLRYLTLWPRFNRVAGWVIACVLVIEVGLIDMQAARGTTSHFNISTPFDGAVFAIMGSSILVLWLFSAGLAVELFRQPFEDRAWGRALRAGMLICLLGSASGGIMARPIHAQLTAIEAGRLDQGAGAHTVGAPDGGPGLPGVDWSTEHGDLRIAHFLGLHSLQVIPFFAWLVRKRKKPERLVLAAAASYLVLFVILLWQALRGEPLIHAHGATLAAMSAWCAGTTFGMKG